MISKENLVNVGYIKRTHSFHGAVHINFIEEVALNKGDFLFLQIEGHMIPYKLLELKGTESDRIAQLEFITTHEQAQNAIGTTVFLDKHKVQYSEEVSLIGYQLIDKNLSDVGEVEDVMELPKQTLLKTTYNGKECFVPYIEAFVEHVNHENREIWLNLPEGLLDL